ncbi:MAG: transposase family protein [Shewanella psychromarinicola]|jgi:putative transposase|uniref:transposase family protein n=1 Tax=Shewanella psychromarinicola TaxID=2487742 RepID=UPI0030013547
MMSGYRDGSSLQTKDGLAKIRIINENLCVLLNDPENGFIQTHTQIEEGLKSGAYIVDTPPVPKKILTKYQISDRDTRLMYVKSLEKVVEEHHVRPTTQKAYNLMIQQVEQDYPITLSLNKHPAKSSVCRYWRMWVNGRCCDDTLVSSRRNAPSRVHPAAEAVLNHYVSTVWSSSHSKLRSGHYKAYCSVVEKESIKNPSISAVSERTFYRRLAELSHIEDEMNSPFTTQARLNQLNLTCQKKIKTEYPLQRVEMDRVDLNLNLIDDNTHELTGKVSIYFAKDVHTRCIIGTVINFGLAENKESVVHLIQQIFMKDENLPFQGKPMSLFMDNGPGFHNSTVDHLCEKLGIEPSYTPANQPSKKPFIESFNNVFRNKFCSSFAVLVKDKLQVGIPGYLGVRNKKGHDKTNINIDKAAQLYKSDFIYLLNYFLCQYSHQTHSMTKKSPFEMWYDSSDSPILEHCSYENIIDKFHVLQNQKNQKLYQNGTVHVQGYKFTSPDLKSLYNRVKPLYGSPEVIVYLNPFDARYVTVSYFDTRTNIQHQILATNIDIDDMPEPVSFKKLKGESENIAGIHLTTKHTVTGKYEATIGKLHVQKRRRNNRGKPTASFEENNKGQLTAEQRVAQSNIEDSKLDVNLMANMRFSAAASHINEVEVEDFMKVDMTGKKRRW